MHNGWCIFIIIIIFWRLFLVPFPDWAVFDFCTSFLFFNWYVSMYMPIPFIFPDSYLCYLHPLISCKDNVTLWSFSIFGINTHRWYKLKLFIDLFFSAEIYQFTGSVELSTDAYLSIKLLRRNWITSVCVVNRSQVISGSVHKESFPLTDKPTSNKCYSIIFLPIINKKS